MLFSGQPGYGENNLSYPRKWQVTVIPPSPAPRASLPEALGAAVDNTLQVHMEGDSKAHMRGLFQQHLKIIKGFLSVGRHLGDYSICPTSVRG